MSDSKAAIKKPHGCVKKPPGQIKGAHTGQKLGQHECHMDNFKALKCTTYIQIHEFITLKIMFSGRYLRTHYFENKGKYSNIYFNIPKQTVTMKAVFWLISKKEGYNKMSSLVVSNELMDQGTEHQMAVNPKKESSR